MLYKNQNILLSRETEQISVTTIKASFKNRKSRKHQQQEKEFI